MVPGLRDWRSAAMVAVSELVSGLDAELVRLGYKASTMVWYRGCWRRLERFFASRVARMIKDFAVHGTVLRRDSRTVGKLTGDYTNRLARFRGWRRVAGRAAST